MTTYLLEIVKVYYVSALLTSFWAKFSSYRKKKLVRVQEGIVFTY